MKYYQSCKKIVILFKKYRGTVKIPFFRMRFEVGAIIRATTYKQTAKPAIQITKQFLSKFIFDKDYAFGEIITFDL